MPRGGPRANSGGKRPGAGRPRKLGAVAREMVEELVSAESEIRRAAREEGAGAAAAKAEEHGWAPDEVRAVIGKKAASELREILKADAGAIPADEPDPPNARSLEGLALATLRQIMRKGPQDGPRVVAAKEVLKMAAEERAASGLSGRKAAQQAAADRVIAGGGKFAAPAPPSTTRAQ